MFLPAPGRGYDVRFRDVLDAFVQGMGTSARVGVRGLGFRVFRI